jgi:transposase
LRGALNVIATPPTVAHAPVDAAPPPPKEAAPPVATNTVQAAANDTGITLAVTVRWTLKRLVRWVEDNFQLPMSRETIRAVLHRLGLSWKKGKKLLARADPAARQSFVDRIKVILQDVKGDKIALVYIDEAHVHLDADLGYLWTIRGERAWVSSTSPGLAKVSFYGVYLYNDKQIGILPHTCGNGENTLDVLQWLRDRIAGREILVIWDGASYHRAGIVKDKAEALNIKIQPLPSYSPDFMPVEALWHWMREEVTYNHCHPRCADLIARVADFAQCINQDPPALATRLRVKQELDPEQEALRLAQWTVAQQHKTAKPNKAANPEIESKRAADEAALARAITAWKGSPAAPKPPKVPKEHRKDHGSRTISAAPG